MTIRLGEMGEKCESARPDEKQAFAQSLFSEVVFDLDAHRITSFTLKPRAVVDGTVTCLEGFETITAPIPTTAESMRHFIALLYADKGSQSQSWGKHERNAAIYRRYLEGEDSVVLARAYGLSDRRVRTIVERERRREDLHREDNG